METPFVWTKKFNRILACFCDKIETKTNQHYFKSFPNSFSGEQAVSTMKSVLAELFPSSDIQRQNAQKVLELLLKDGVIIAANKVDQIKDEKDVFYKFGKQVTTDKYIARPRRSVSVDQCKRFTQPRMSIISPDHFNSEPEICAPSTSASSSNSVMNSMENMCEKEHKPNQMEIDAAALRFLRWVSVDETISEVQRKKTIKAFKSHYPNIYKNFVKSPSISSAPQNMFGYRQQSSLDSRSTPLSPSTSHYSIQSDLGRSVEELSQYRVSNNVHDSPKRRNIRLSEAELKFQLTEKLNSVVENPVYSQTERQRILKYFKHVYPAIYRERFNEDRPFLKKIREFLPKITSEVR
ncbi:hypothetical protein M3Y97_00631500 [Aphelenchoides bicaudatus]|nr:hypothetical protein M3Y97_00631500 [Aphelenchoides bicaudatus]